jgi:hypothetical protein
LVPGAMVNADKSANAKMKTLSYFFCSQTNISNLQFYERKRGADLTYP